MKKIGILMIALLLSACEETEVARDVAYYMENKTEREEKLAYCRADARHDAEPNCSNAVKANAKESIRIMLNEGYARPKKQKSN